MNENTSSFVFPAKIIKLICYMYNPKLVQDILISVRYMYYFARNAVCTELAFGHPLFVHQSQHGNYGK